MKTRKYTYAILQYGIHSIIILFVLAFLTGCGSGDSPSAKEVITNMLTAHSWKLSSVTVDGIDQTSLFNNMTLSFTATSFTTTNGGLVWPASGTWTFKDEEGKIIVRGDGLEVNLIEVKDDSLNMSLTWNKNTFGPGRVGSIAGVHIFKMIKP